jgi:hypothetical protein
MHIIEFFKALWRRPVRLTLIGFPVLFVAVPLYLVPVAGPVIAIASGTINALLMLVGLVRDQKLQQTGS